MTATEATTKKERKRQLEARAWKVLCVKCGAQPGEGCISEAGVRCGIHAVRIRHGQYLPVPR